MATKECVACAEEIQSNARMCRYCSTIQDDPRFAPEDADGGTVNDEVEAKNCQSCWDRPARPDGLYCDECLGDDSPPVHPHLESIKSGKKPKVSKDAKQSSLSCPICGRDDASQTVASIVDGGVSSTSGTALTMGRNFQYAATGFNSVSVSDLANRLAGPSQPSYSVFAGFLFLLFCLTNVVALLFRLSPFKDVFEVPYGSLLMYFFSGAIALIPSMLFASNATSSVFNASKDMKSQINHWEKCQNRLRRARYCLRDDVIYDAEASGDPESFIDEVWSATPRH